LYIFNSISVLYVDENGVPEVDERLPVSHLLNIISRTSRHCRKCNTQTPK
jgi:hypothetical protein